MDGTEWVDMEKMVQSHKMMWCCWMDKEGDGGDPAVIASTSLKISAMHHHNLLLLQPRACLTILCLNFRVHQIFMLDILECKSVSLHLSIIYIEEIISKQK